jgi:hypothetical protein
MLASHYHCLIVYRNFAARGASHVGLGVNGLHTAKVLRANGVLADLEGVWTPQDVHAALAKSPTVTHCLIEAPWLPAAEQAQLLQAFPHVQFVVRCHSQIGFLQVEPGAIKLLRDLATLEGGSLNFRLGCNNLEFQRFFQKAYHHPCLLLPNLYDFERVDRYHPHQPGQTLRIGSFGALRLMKNHTTAAAAALLIARRRHAHLEFYVSVNRMEGPGSMGVLQSVRNMFEALTWAKLIEHPWAPAAQFRAFIGGMDLCLQLSQSETFNIVTADAAAEHVPTVVSDAIDWVPPNWIAHSDKPEKAAQTGCALLEDPYAGQEGYDALTKYVHAAVVDWKRYLTESARAGVLGLPALI